MREGMLRERVLMMPDGSGRGGMIRAIPRHVAIIPDGNRRWARAWGLGIADGHRQGAEHLWAILPVLLDRGVREVSFFLFSTENWSRSPEEVGALFTLLTEFFGQAAMRAVTDRFIPQVIGDLTEPRLPPALRRSARHIGALVPPGTSWPTVTFLVNYGATRDVLSAAERMLADPGPGLLGHLSTSGLSPVDLVVRAGGERRLSNFFLLEAAYAELAFVDELWPDLSAGQMAGLLDWYGARQRRFGGDTVAVTVPESAGPVRRPEAVPR
jgi:undecaprenyl diphosphate synthase